jgi:hypothetical protein
METLQPQSLSPYHKRTCKTPQDRLTHPPSGKLAKRPSLQTSKTLLLPGHTPRPPLPNAFNITNTQRLIQDLQHTPITPTSTVASLDVTNMYSNMPVTQTKHILENTLCHNHTDPAISTELLAWYETITQQNYF